MMIVRSCASCGAGFYAPAESEIERCWRCERRARAERLAIADRLLAQVFPNGLPADD